jgi:hypothetical protein
MVDEGAGWVPGTYVSYDELGGDLSYEWVDGQITY